MTSTTSTVKPMTCPVTHLPYVHHIAFLDMGASPEWPVHIVGRVEFDGVPVKGVLGRIVEVCGSRVGATVVILEVLAEFVTPPFMDSDGNIAPATIDGHPFLTPRDAPWHATNADLWPLGQDYPSSAREAEAAAASPVVVRCEVHAGRVTFA